MTTSPPQAGEAPRVRLEPAGKRLRVTLGAVTVVDSPRAIVVYERGLEPRYYVPREDVQATLTEGSKVGQCPWKGSWRWLEVSAGGQVVAEAAWTYFATTEVCTPIQDYVAFVPAKMTSFELT